jgi:hypothetical protein
MASAYRAPRVAGTVTVTSVSTHSAISDTAATAGGSLFPQSSYAAHTTSTAQSGGNASDPAGYEQKYSFGAQPSYQATSTSIVPVAAAARHGDIDTMLRVERKVDALAGEMHALRTENAQLRETLMGLSVLGPLASRVEALTALVTSLSKVPRALPPVGGVGVSPAAAVAGNFAATPGTPFGVESSIPAPKSSNGKVKIWVGSWNVGAEVSYTVLAAACGFCCSGDTSVQGSFTMLAPCAGPL